MTFSSGEAAQMFILHAIQEWGQPEEKRIAAVQAILDAAGFSAVATCWPVFGGIWKSPCSGPEGQAATKWLEQVTADMRRGKYEKEIEHVCQMIEARKSEKKPA